MILVLGGTVEGREIAKNLYRMGWDTVLSVATSYGAFLSFSGDCSMVRGRMDREEMKKFIRNRKIDTVVDATHPFAREVSLTAIEVCKELAVRYIRYERQRESYCYHRLHWAEDFYRAADIAACLGQVIFLTTGSKDISIFTGRCRDRQIIARVLPLEESLRKCFEAGLTPEDIVAAKGPFSVQLNREMFRYYGADVVVTKESGASGGTGAKVEAARQLGIPVVMVVRPAISYPLVVDDFEKLYRLLEE